MTLCIGVYCLQPSVVMNCDALCDVPLPCNSPQNQSTMNWNLYKLWIKETFLTLTLSVEYFDSAMRNVIKVFGIGIMFHTYIVSCSLPCFELVIRCLSFILTISQPLLIHVFLLSHFFFLYFQTLQSYIDYIFWNWSTVKRLRFTFQFILLSVFQFTEHIFT